MKIISLLLLILFHSTCQAEDQILYVESNLQDEASSEEAIMLVQCLTGDGRFSWQLQGKNKNIPNISFSQSQNQGISMDLDSGKEKIHRNLQQGQLLAECENTRAVLEKYSNVKLNLKPNPWRENALPETLDQSEESSRTKLLPWVIGAGVLIGGFFFWKSRQADFNRIETRTQ